jgi:hypothetical protein
MPLSSPAAVRQDVAMANGMSAGTVVLTQIVSNPVNLADVEPIVSHRRAQRSSVSSGRFRDHRGGRHFSR